MAIKDHEDNKLTPREAAKLIVERQLEGCLYWHEHDGNGFYDDDMTAREKTLVTAQVEKILTAIRKQLRRKSS